MRIIQSWCFAATASVVRGSQFDVEDDDLNFLRLLAANNSNATTSTSTTTTTSTVANATSTTTTTTTSVGTTNDTSSDVVTVGTSNLFDESHGATGQVTVTHAAPVTYSVNASVDANATRQAVTATMKISAPTPLWASSGDLSWKASSDRRALSTTDAAEAAKLRSAYNLYCSAIADAAAVTSCNVLDAQGKINPEYAASNGGGYYFAAISECYTVLKNGAAIGTSSNCWDTAGFCLGNNANHNSNPAVTMHTSCVTENAADDYSVSTTFAVPPEKLAAEEDVSSLDLSALVSAEASSTTGMADLKKNLKASTIVAVAFIQENVYSGVETNVTSEFGISSADLKTIATAASSASGDASMDAVLTASAGSAYTQAKTDATVDYSNVAASAVVTTEGGSPSSTSAASARLAGVSLIILTTLSKFLF